MPLVAPTHTDPVARVGAGFLGGPLGRWARVNPWTRARALQVVLGVGTLTYLLGALRTIPCANVNWAEPDRSELLCYSDIPILYVTRGLAGFPYLSWPVDGQPLEYPVLTGLFTWIASLPAADNVSFYWVNVALLFCCFLVALAATATTVPFRVWDGLLMAAAPSVALAGLINWDWLVVALTALGIWAWARARPVVAGVLLGLAIAAKFYPLLLFGPLLVLAFRRQRMTAATQTLASAVVTWLLVNVPFAVLNFEGWSFFFRFSAERGQDFGSPWLALSIYGFPVPRAALDQVGVALLVLFCAAIAALIWYAPRPPRLASVLFLVVAAFIITNKVYSPQFVLWLLPLAVLARPRWRDILIWQACEVVYFVAIWWYLVGFNEGAQGLDERTYALAILVHVAGVLYLVVLVVRDVLRPEFDPVRRDRPFSVDSFGGFDDPGGGVLDQAPDRRTALRTSAMTNSGSASGLAATERNHG